MILSVAGAVRSLVSSIVAYAMSDLINANHKSLQWRDTSCAHFCPVVQVEFLEAALAPVVVDGFEFSIPHSFNRSITYMQCSLTRQYRHHCASVFDLRSLHKFGASVRLQLSV